MNKRAYRLVFDRRRGMCVATGENVSATGKSASGEKRSAGGGASGSTPRGEAALGSALLALALPLLGAGLAQDAQAQYRNASPMATRAMAATNVPSMSRNTLPVRSTDAGQLALDRGSFSVGAPTGTGLDITQYSDKAIINWQSFNIGQDMLVRFLQPSSKASVLNQIWDANPSVLMGQIQANGEVILQNRNGFIFSPTARVDTASFVATALRMSSETFMKGWRNLKSVEDGAAFDSTDAALTKGESESDEAFAARQAKARSAAASAQIAIQAGAEIKTAAGGDVVIVAPQVYNGGTISVNQGTATLVAGQEVYLYNSVDAAQRGLIVLARPAADVPLSGTVENLNTIKAEQGRVNLVGMTVRQNGNITATTAVKGLNGQIYLQSASSLVNGNNAQVSDAAVMTAQNLATVEFGEGSVTQITASSSSGSQKDSDTFYRSLIQVNGKDVRVRSGATIEAISGNVNIVAAETNAAHVLSREGGQVTSKDNSSLVVDSGATISARGLRNVALDVSRNQLDGRLFSIELADSPVQRGSVAYRREVMVDARQAVGFANVKGFYNTIERSAQELSTRGGNVTLLSQGSMVLADGLKLDVSGGSLAYSGGNVATSLLRKGSALIPLFNADPNQVYDQLYSAGQVKWVSNVSSFLQGADAGSINLGAMAQAIGNISFAGDVVIGRYQRTSAQGSGYVTAANTDTNLDYSAASYLPPMELGRSAKLVSNPNLYASLQPAQATLSWGLGKNATITKAPSSDPGNVEVYSGAVQLVAGPVAPVANLPELPKSAEAMAALGSDLSLSVNALNAGGIGNVSLAGKKVNLAADANLNLGASGSLNVVATDGVNLQGKVRAAGGMVNVLLTSAAVGDVVLGKAASIDLSGDMQDERHGFDPQKTLNVNGGSLSVMSVNGIEAQAGSLIKVSAGALRQSGLSKGSAGSVSLSINSRNAAGLFESPATLKLGSTMEGYGFDSGGSLALSGMYGLAVANQVSSLPETLDPRTFKLAANFFGSGGFSKLSLRTLGDASIADGTQITPSVSSWAATPAAVLAGQTQDVARVVSQSELRRPKYSLSLTVGTAPNSARLTSLAGTGHFTLGKDSLIDVGAAGSIAATAGYGIDLAGSLVAHGGSVTLSLANGRGRESPSSEVKKDFAGYVNDQVLHLASTGLIDVSGQAVVEVTNSRVGTIVTGKVLGGGTVSLNEVVDATQGPNRGSVVTDVGSLINVSGASSNLSMTSRGTSLTQVSQGAGSVGVGAADGWLLQGTLKAHAPNASAGGGQFKATLSTEGFVTQVTEGSAYPEGAASEVHLYDQLPSTAALSFAKGQLASSALLSAGFDQITLRADDAIVLHQGAGLAAASNQARLRSVQLTAPVLRADDGGLGLTHSIVADRVSLGNADLRMQNGSSAFVAPTALGGTSSLKAQAGLIEVWGQFGLQGFGLKPDEATGPEGYGVQLLATLPGLNQASRTNGEIRFIGRENVALSSLSGGLNFAGQLTLQAGQIYATTLSSFSIKGLTGSAFSTLLPVGGSSSVTPLSAAASLSVDASDIVHGGVIRQPFGSISLTSNGTPQLLDGSILSVSGNGVTVPMGSLLNGVNWVYTPGGSFGGITSGTPSISLNDLVINKSISINGSGERSSLKMASTAVIDASAGGDLLANEFVPGVGGSTNTLLRAGVYAVLPNYGYDFAPYDRDMAATAAASGTALQAGDQIEIITPNGVLATGRYTLLPARYAVLPGAVLVSTTRINNINKPLATASLPSDDGSVIVSGYKTATGTQITGGSDPQLALLLEPSSTYSKKSAIELTSINQFRTDLAGKTGASVATLPVNAGLVSLTANLGFNWAADLRLEGGMLDLSMPSIEVVANADATGADGKVSADSLSKSKARSVLLGGKRTANADGSGYAVETRASRVDINADLSTGEVLAAATDAVAVGAGVTVASTAAAREQSQTLTFTGAGAALAVSDNLGLSFKRTVSSAAARTGTLDASQGAFSGAAVLLDGSGKLSLSGATRLNTRSLDLSTSRIVLSQADRTETRANTLNLAGAAALGQLNQLSRLRLRAIDAIEFADAVSLGQGLRADGMASTMDRLTLDAAAIRGQAGVVKLAAQQVVLANSSGLVATEADKAGGGALAIQAQPAPSDLPRRSIVIGQGQQYAAFDQVKLDTTADVVFDGQASLLSTQGDVNITADRVTATTTTTHGLAAAGELTIARPAGLSEPKGLQGLGASVALSAKRIVQGGRIDLASGQLSLSASGTGLTSVALEAGSVPTTAQLAQAQVDRSAIVFAQGSVTDVSGRQVTNVGGWSTSTAGGSISAQAVAGDVLVNGLLNVSAGMQGAQSDAAKSAGQIKLAAAAGQVVLEQSAALKGTASTAAQSGRLVVDAGSVVQGAALSAATNAAAKASQGTLDTLATLAREGGLQREFNVRVRRGDQSLNTQVQAIRTLIAADGGKLDLNAQANIQASAPQGGLVQLSAKNDVTLNGATINANSTRVGANGGDVMMNSTDGVVHAEGAASISATGDDALDGRVLMVSNDEALLKLADAAFANGVTATPKATAKIAAAEVAVVGNHVFEGQSLDGAADAVTGTVRKDAVTKVATVTKTLTTITGTGANRKTTIKQTVTTTPSTYTEVYRKNEATGLFELVLTSDTLVGASSTVTTTLANNRAFVSTDKAGTVTAPTTVALSVQSSGEVQTVALNDLTLTADALTRRASDVLQALSLADSVKVRGGVELQAKGADFVLNDALALNDHRSGGQPLFLTIRSDQNIRINAELSDGFASLGRANTSSATATPTPTALVAGDAASFRLVAGADLGASNMLATQAGAAADLLLGAKALVRTTSGSIELAAARNIELQSDYSDATKTTFSQARVYVAGRPVEGTSSTVSSTDADSGLNTSTTTTVASKVTDAWASFTFHGGRLGAQAGQDILAAGDQQGINNWFDHVATYVQDNEGNSQLSHVAWWSALDAVKQGLGSFGGGNVEVNAGRDIRNLSVWAPTARDVVSTDITTTVFDADGNAMDTSTRHVGDAASVLNGGDITVRAGRDVLGGQYFLGRGLGQVSAGRDLGNGSLVGAPNASAENRSAVLGQMDGDWMVESGRNLTLGLAFNPTLGTTSKRLGTDASGSTGAYVTYGDTSQLSLSSAAGDLIYKTDDWINAYASLVRADYNTGNDQTSASKDSIKYFSYLAAPVVHLAATAGGVTFKPQVGATGTATATASAGLYLMPSAKGDLSIDSAKDLVLSTVVLSGQMLAAALPTMAAPLSAADLYGTVNPFASQVQNPLLNEASNPSQLNSSRIYSDLLHEQDTVPARISAGQDIKNGGVTARLVSTKPARITAGRDILLNNLDLVVQNFDAADISLVSAGRNILGGTTSGVNLGVIRLHGAGNLRVEAGRQLTLGNSSGLESQGNLFNTALPDAGGSITAKSGVNKTLDVDAFVGKYLGDDASRAALVADVASRMNLTGSLSFDQALAYWRGMSSASQRAFADALLAERFKNAYLPAGSAFLAQWQAAAAAAGTQANDFKSLAFQRFKDEVIYSEVARLGALASVISDSENPTENAKRKAQRNAIWSQADALVGLAGWGEGFNFKGDIELTASKIQTFGSGAFNQGGLNLMAPGGQVVVGLSALSAADRKDEVASKRGLITKDGGSIRVFTDLDFQVNAQKAFVVGQGDLMVFSQQGSIDSGRGSNTDVSPYTPQYKRLLDGSVVRVANNGTTGSGIGVLPNANGVADGAVKLYAPRGEVKALDAFIRGPEIEIASPKVLGADNLKGSVSGVAAAPTVGFALSPTTGVKDDAASGNLKEVASAQEAKKKQSSSLVTVDVVSLGDSAAPTAAGTPEAAPCTTPDCRKSKSGATP